MPRLCTDCRHDRPTPFFAHLNDPAGGKETSSCIRCRVKRLTWYDLKRLGDDDGGDGYGYASANDSANEVRDAMTAKVVRYADAVGSCARFRRLTDEEFRLGESAFVCFCGCVDVRVWGCLVEVEVKGKGAAGDPGRLSPLPLSTSALLPSEGLSGLAVEAWLTLETALSGIAACRKINPWKKEVGQPLSSTPSSSLPPHPLSNNK